MPANTRLPRSEQSSAPVATTWRQVALGMEVGHHQCLAGSERGSVSHQLLQLLECDSATL